MFKRIVAMSVGGSLMACDGGAATSEASASAGTSGSAKQSAPWLWPSNALAAVSLTYDDGNASQLDETIPELEAAGFRGTFYLHIGRGDMQARVAEWRAAHQRGHEMGNHTVQHAGRGEPYIKRDGRLPAWMPLPLERFTPKMIADEVTAAADWLDKNIGPDPDRTFAYPCNAVAIGDPPDEASYAAAILRHHFAARGGVDPAVNDPRTLNLLRIAAFDGEGTDPAPLIAPCKEALAVGGWTVLSFHATERASHQALIAHLRANRYWVAPVKTVARYVQATRGDRVTSSVITPTAAAAPTPNPGKGLWPPEPVNVSKTEGIIEVFWDFEYKAASRWTLGPQGVDAQLVPSWDQVMIQWKPKAAGETLELQRPYDLDVSGYRRLIVRARTGPDIKTTVLAVVDGKPVRIVKDMPGQLSTVELAGAFEGSHLEQVKVVFTAAQAGALTFQLRWVMVDKPGISWDAPTAPFDGMLVEKPISQFEPGIGLLSSAADVEQMRQEFNSPSHAEVARIDRDLAAQQAKIDPASLIRRYALYVGGLGHFGRTSDGAHDFNNDGLTLACVGLMTRNEAYMRLAAKHAIVLARMEHWSEGFVDRFPDAPYPFGWSRPWQSWRHTGFAPNVASIQAALLLDMTWNWLTPAGRQLILTALREKGIPYFGPFLPPRYGANQGARFTKGYVLARMATAPSISDPALQVEMRQLLKDFNECVTAQTREDGTFEEDGYGQSVIENIAGTYQAFSRCLRQPTHELVPPRLLKSMRFMLDSDRTVSAHVAAFGAGPLGEELFGAYRVPTHLTSGWNPENHGYGLESVWYPASRAQARKRTSTPFSNYPDGGWVFMGSEDPALTRVSLESGFWGKVGHIWTHKNTVTLDAFGETLLLTRQYAMYTDARCARTARAAAYNTFTPGERNMDLNPSGAQGARLILAKDLGAAAVAVSDAASAWQKGVRKALRRVILLRPNVLIVEDTAEFDAAEPGVQNWNSLGNWKKLNDTTCELRVGKAKARLTVITPQTVAIDLAEDSIHLERLTDAERVRTGNIYREREVQRATFTSPAAKQHRVLTVIEAFDAKAQTPASTVTVVRKSPLIVDIAQGNMTARLADGPATEQDLWGWKGDGEWLLVIREGDKVVATHAF